ncbi:MAG: GGDEF and EAL domain-containing protein [Firmicutes bacterium]|nr:GGDEF and EAL domain-containing protein [Bacillota bacterium]
MSSAKRKKILAAIAVILALGGICIIVVMSTQLDVVIGSTEKDRMISKIGSYSKSNESTIVTYFAEKISGIETLANMIVDVSECNIFEPTEVTAKFGDTDEYKTLSNVKMTSTVKKIVDSYHADKALSYIGVANVKGESFMDDYTLSGVKYGDRIVDIGSMSQFKLAMEGTTYISGVLKSPISNSESFVVFTPIIHHGEIHGVVFMGYLRERINNLIVNLMSDASANYVLANKVEGGGLNVIATDSEIDDSILATIPSDTHEIRQVTLGNIDFYAVMADVHGKNNSIGSDWVLMTVVEKSNAEAYSKKYVEYSRNVTLLISFVVILCVVIIAVVISYASHEKTKDLQKSKATLEFLKRYTFEYDIKAQKVHFSEITKNILGLEVIDYTFDRLVELGYLTTSDVNAMNELYKNLESGTIFEYEFFCARLKKYFKISASFIFLADSGDCFMGIIEDITANHIEREELKDKAQTDGMTKLYNRETFSYKVEEMKVEQDSLDALMLIDIDNFKNINDSFGHMTGDRVLLAVADALKNLKETCPFVKVVSRFGGDEFGIYLSGMKMDTDVSTIAKRVVNKITLSTVEKGVETSISIGIALRTKDGNTFSELYQCADNALYASKKIKGSSFTVYDSIDKRTLMAEDAVDDTKGKLCLPSDIKESLILAMANDEFDIYVQPYRYCHKNALGGEVLTRWNSSSFGLVMPSTFIPMLEENGLMTQFDMYVLDKVFRLANELVGYGEVGLSINQAVDTFINPSYVDTILKLKQNVRSDVVFTIEITERGECKSFRTLSKTIKTLSEHGIRVALDDFGTANSSLAVLNELEIAELKIDRSFMAFPSESAKTSKAIISSIVMIAKKLGINVVAEGVETKPQFDYLYEIGCDVLQGFYIAVPITYESFKEYLKINRG